MDKTYERLVEKAKELELTMAFVTAGGAAGLYRLFRIPGCSKVLQEAKMLYSAASFDSFLEAPSGDKFVSQEMADRLSRRLFSKTQADICVALTCALKTDRARRGDDRGHLSLCLRGSLASQAIIEVEGVNRAVQDDFISDSVVKLIYEYMDTLT